MKSKGLLTASFLLLVLSAVIWWSNKKAATADKTPVETASVKLLNLPEDQIQNIEIKKRTGETLQLQRNDSQWQITAPRLLRADADAVSSMLSTLSSLSSDRTVEEKATTLDQYGLTQPAIELNIVDKKLQAAFASGTLLVTAKVMDVSGAQELQVRKNKDDYYAKSSAVTGVYKVSTGTGTGLEKGLDDFRNKKLFDFAFADPEKIELHNGPKSYFLTRSGGDWWSNGTKMDPG